MGLPKIGVIAGVAAALLTASWDLWGPSAASALFGGLHNSPPIGPLMFLATVINGLAWGGAASLASRAWARRGRR